MGLIDVDRLLDEITAEQPCGEDLEYDDAFTELEIAAKGKAEQEFGDTLIEAEEPDWAEVEDKAMAVLHLSKDLRVAMHLVRSLLKTEGLDGLNQGLELIRGYVEQYWDSVHPQLDPEDDNDPTMRVNILKSLADEDIMLRAIRTSPLTDSRVVGRFSLRDIAIANGELPPPENAEEGPADMTTIEAAFLDTDPERLQTLADAVRESMEHVTCIESTVTDVVEAGAGPDLSDLGKALKEVHSALAARLGGGEGEAAEEELEEGIAEAGPDTGGGAISGAVRNRNDVIRMLDKIIDYYAHSEPSSPLPLLLQRAKRLVSKDFMTILRDIAPDGVGQASTAGGISEDEYEK
jgi:type VI secretion system protein ImpA